MSMKTMAQALNAYNDSYASSKIDSDNFSVFTDAYSKYLLALKKAIENSESEENIKNLINDFLKKSIYSSDDYTINTKDSIDSAIMRGDKLMVMIEAKAPFNRAEMVIKDNINRKALHELIYYYLAESRTVDGPKVDCISCEIRRLVITNGLEWFIFDINDIDKLCDGYLEKLYYKYKNNQLNYSNNTAKFYDDIEKYLSKSDLTQLNYVYFHVDDIQTVKDKRELYKVLSYPFLLKEAPKLQVKVHTLNDKFYKELLYIMGLQEEKVKNKTQITINHSVANTFAVQLYRKFKYDKEIDDEEKVVEKTFELIIIWLNRLLFIKLFEGQLISFNSDSDEYHILDTKKIKSFDDLMYLFFNVLGKKEREESEFYNRFKEIPYLNSSLFERQEIESQDVNINELKNENVEVKSNSVFGKKAPEKMPLLQYAIEFLNSYTFCSDSLDNGSGAIIDATVLGLIFEKINGYKDGAIYTPSVITEFISKEAIALAVVNAVNSSLSWNCNSVEEIALMIKEVDIKDRLTYRKRINEIINKITICDPAVGSGHFLVSALNYLISVKQKIGVLFYFGTDDLVDDYSITIVDDVLTVLDGQENYFVYDKANVKSQRLQKTLFNEKRTLIENCLFGVDINSKAVYICQLRLWIELLKNAYYEKGVMETLPNIDIKVKTGNSLVHKIGFKVGKIIGRGNQYIDSAVLRDYRVAVKRYIETPDKTRKREIFNSINEIKFRLKNNYVQLDLFERNPAIDNSDAIYDDGFEWAIEFPEIIDENGRFLGFDCIIGNPPYGVSYSDVEKEYLKETYYDVHTRTIDSYNYFISESMRILKEDGLLSFIVPNTLLFQNEYEKTRDFLLGNRILYVVNLGDNIFDKFSVPTCIIEALKQSDKKRSYDIKYMDYRGVSINNIIFGSKEERITSDVINQISGHVFGVNNTKVDILNKIRDKSVTVNDIAKEVASGISTGANDVFCIDNNTISKYDLEKEIIFPMISGKDIDCYYITWDDEYIIYSTKDSNTPHYDNLIKYLTPNKETLSKKRETKKGILPWWCLHWPRNPELFKGTKIVLRQTSDRIRATVDLKGYYALNSLLVVRLSDELCWDYWFVLAILNSKLNNFIYQNLTQEISRGFAEVKPVNVRKLYIPNIDRDSQNDYIEIAKKIYEGEIDTKDGMNQIDKMIYQYYELSEEEVSLIENDK